MNARLTIAVVAVGVGLGTAAAFLDRDDQTRAASPIARSATPPPTQRVPIARVGPVQLVARADDPGGEAPWAVRRFRARERGRTFTCVQLGRVQDDRFGWLAAGQAFRLARFDYDDVPISCGNGAFRRGLPELAVTTLTTDPRLGLPAPARTVVWGRLPPGVIGVRLRDGTRLDAHRDNIVLAVLPGRQLGRPSMAGTLISRDGGRRAFAFPTPAEGSRNRDPAGGRPRLGRARVALRAADPAGGAGWGLFVTTSTRGRRCFGAPARVVGDRPAFFNPRLGIATLYPFAFYDCSPRRAPTRAHPLRASLSLSSIPEEDPAGTQQLRRLVDRTALYGRATADVESVRITTSRDIRTVVPDPRTHLILVVYDGSFPGETLRLTARLRDGRRVTVLLSSGA